MTYPEGAIRSAALHARAKAVMPGGNSRTTVFMRPFPIYASHGAGCRVWDVDGVARIDCINNFTSLIHGYACPEINAAVARQLERGTAFGLPTETEIELAEILCERLPVVEQVRFCNSGTEAVMTALKAARAYTGRPKIAKVEGAYHGSYDYAEVSLDSRPGTWGEATAPRSTPYAHGTPPSVLDEVVTLPANDPEAAAELIRRHGPELAAVLLDPMPNRAGLVPLAPAYLAAVRAATREAGVLLIYDEVITFRLSPGGAQGLWGGDPDLTTLGKIIGGGFPVGAVGGRAEVMRVFDPSGGRPPVPHGGTFSANPVTMAAGVASMRLLDAPAFDALDRRGEAVRAGVREALAAAGVEGAVVGAGSLLRVHFTAADVTDYRSAYAEGVSARRLAAFYLGLLNRGVLAAPTGLMALSTAMTDDDVAEIVAAARGAAQDAAKIEGDPAGQGASAALGDL